MGERILRPGIRTSEKTAVLVRDGGWMPQVFFDWLLTLVDDYGRYDARPAILRAEVFPLLLELVREADVSRCLEGLQAAGLVRLYTVDGRPYVEILNFKQRKRAMQSKWPAPDGSAGHCQDNGMTMPINTETETETIKRGRRHPRDKPEHPLPADLDVAELRTAWHDWHEHRAGIHKPLSERAAVLCFARFRDWGAQRSVAAIEHSIASGYQGIFEPKNGQKSQPKHGADRWVDKPYLPG